MATGVDGGVSDHFRRWLRVGTGCGFATKLAASGSVAYDVRDEPLDAAEVDAYLLDYARRGLSVMLILPSITTEPALVRTLRDLRA